MGSRRTYFSIAHGAWTIALSPRQIINVLILSSFILEPYMVWLGMMNHASIPVRRRLWNKGTDFESSLSYMVIEEEGEVLL